MNRVEIDALLNNPYLATAAYFSVALLLLVIFLAIFEVVSSYKTWDEISKGNVSVAMAVGGKIFGICNIFRFAVSSGGDIYYSFLWGAIGSVLLLITYFIFEFLTPIIKVDKELAKDNRAVGLLSLSLSIAVSYVVGSSIKA